jgi:TRAP transporter TAXI family solute receptor
MKRPIQRLIPFGVGLIIVLGVAWLLKPPQCIRIAAGREGGDAHNLALLMKKFIPIYSEQKVCIAIVGTTVGAKGEKQTDGTQENLEMLEKKQTDLAAAQADILIMKNLPSLASINGKPWNAPPPKQLTSSQLVSLLFPDAYQLVVRNDTNIKSVSDLAKDKKVAMPPREGGQIESFVFLMQYYGLITKNQQLVKIVEVGNTNKDVKDALCNLKKVDAVFYVRAIDNENIREILSQCGRLVPIDQAAAMTIKNPYLQEAQIPEGAYRGGISPIPSNDVDSKQKLTTVSTPRLLLAHKDVDREAIRIVTKILYEHRQDFIKEMPLIANMSSPDNMKRGIGLPIHLGAQAYYDREKPSWLERYSESLAFLITIASIGLSGIFWLTQRFEQIRKNKADDYIREVNALMDAEDCIKAVVGYLEAKQSNNSQQLKNMKDVIVQKVARILVEKRIAELALEKQLISGESLKSFSKTLRKVNNTIEKLSIDESEDIFNYIPQNAIEILNERAVNALVEKRISQESFQSFQVIWQVTAGDNK